MKSQNHPLADVRKALSSQQISTAKAAKIQGGSRPALTPARLPLPFVVDTDRPG